MTLTSCPMGTSGFECSFVIYILPALLVLISILFRKNVANDMMDRGFSIIGGSVLSVLTYYILYAIFHSVKYSLGGGIVAMLLGGFLLSNIIGDGEA